MFYEKPQSGDWAQCLDCRVNSSQVVQEGYSKEVPFEHHLSNVTMGKVGIWGQGVREVEKHTCKGPEVAMHLALGFKKHTW